MSFEIESNCCLKIDDKFTQNLQDLASSLGYQFNKRLSTTALIEAIAIGELEIVKSNPRSDILDKIIQKINKEQPFRLSYLDAAGKAFVFDCTYATFSTYEAKEYLEIMMQFWTTPIKIYIIMFLF